MTCSFVRVALLGLLLSAPAAGGDDVLRVRASAAARPCVVAVAGHGAGLPRLAIETLDRHASDAADVFVATSVEMARLLESGRAEVNSDVEVADIPWALVSATGGPLGARSLAEAKQKGAELVVLGGAEAHEARRLAAGGRVRESTDEKVLRAAPLALVPVSLAGSGERARVDAIPPLRVSAAIAQGTSQPGRAREFLRYMETEAGRRAFAACGQAAP